MHSCRWLVVAVLIACTGCGTVRHVRQFRIVDSASGKPLENVHAEGFSKWPTSWNHVQRSGPYTATSDTSGLLRFDDEMLGAAEATFEKEGYERCCVVADSPGYRKRGWLARPTFAWEHENTAVIELSPLQDE